MEEVLYCYGFVPSGTGPPPADALPGIADRPVEIVDLGFCEAVVSRLPAEDYGPEVVESRLRDLEWVGAQGLAHERVVTWYVDEAWILPARLLTLYSAPSALEEEATSREAELSEALDRMEGMYEWDLKVSYDAGRLKDRLGDLSEEIAELEERIASTSAGRGYLLGRVKDEKIRTESADVARRIADGLLEELERGAEEVARVELPGKGSDLPVVLNAALLVRSGGEDRLTAAVERRTEELEEHGIHVDFSGPWAPYRFLGDRDDSGPDHGRTSVGPSGG